MLTRVRMRGYKSFPDVDVRLMPLTVLFGANASGKSNLLDALRLLSGIVTRPSLKEAFEPPHRGKPMEVFPLGEKGVRDLPARGRLAFSLEADLRLSDTVVRAVEREIREAGGPAGNGRGRAGKQPSPVRHRSLRYRVEIEMSRKSGLCVADERLVALNAQGRPSGACRPFIERDGERLRLRWEGRRGRPVCHERRLGRSVLSARFHAPGHPHAAAVRREMEGWRFFYFEPMRRMRGPVPHKETRHIGAMGEDLSTFFLALKNRKPRKFDAVNQALSLLLPGTDGIEVGVNRLGDVELAIREDGATVSERVMSDGALRILGLLAMGGVDEPPALIGLEEPETGVYPERLGLVGLLLENRTWSGQTQCIVTTHSTELLDHLPEESILFVRKVDNRTEFRAFDDWPPRGWKAAKAREGAPGEPDGDPPPPPTSGRILRGDFG